MTYSLRAFGFQAPLKAGLAALCLTLAHGQAPPPVQTWDKVVAPGVIFRMEVESNPARTVYGLRIDPTKLRIESRLAGDAIYEENGSNGRGTVSQMAKSFGALTGINGDFFQWTPDPGGDPLGLALNKGRLFSGPAEGRRNVAVGWGPGLPYSVVSPTFAPSATVGGKTISFDIFNGKVPKDGAGISFEEAVSIYGEEPLTTVRLHLPQGRPPLGGKVKAVAIEVRSNVNRAAVRGGQAVIGASGKSAESLAGIKVGDRVELDLTISGIPKGVEEAMGGWPVLLKNGAYAGPKEDEKAPAHPRSAMGVTADGQIWHVVIDGRQEMSVGTTHTETAAVMKRLGCVNAVNLDGGGSSTLYALGIVLNRPSGGVERTVANGIFSFGSPVAPGPEFSIKGSAALKVGEKLQLAAESQLGPIPHAEVIWTAQGGAWIDQDGFLRGVKAGAAVVRALYKGRIASKQITVE